MNFNLKPATRKLTAAIALLMLAACDTYVPPPGEQGQAPPDTGGSSGLRAGIEAADLTLASRHDAVLLGKDEDHNGVRDDVDALVAKYAAETPAGFDPFVNTMYAKLARLDTDGILVDLNDKQKVLEITHDQMLAVTCIGDQWRAVRGVNDRTYLRITHTIRDAVLNTKPRYKADRALWEAAGLMLIDATTEYDSAPCLHFE